MKFPIVNVNLRLRDPDWIPEYDPDGKATNMDSYTKFFNVEAEVIQLNLSANTMRIRFKWAWKGDKHKPNIVTHDVPMEAFTERYSIQEK
jgi:hypothetical protein